MNVSNPSSETDEQQQEAEMGFSLSNDEARQRETLAAELEGMETQLSAAIKQFNETMKTAWADVERVQEEYNARIRVAQAFIETIHKKYDAKYDAKSEEWQEGEEGEPVSEWIGDWSIQLDESDLEVPEDVELVGSASDELGELPLDPTTV